MILSTWKYNEKRQRTTALEARTTSLNSLKGKAAEAQELLRPLKDDPDPHRKMLCMDLQQALVCPKLATGMAYYKMKVWVYSF